MADVLSLVCKRSFQGGVEESRASTEVKRLLFEIAQAAAYENRRVTHKGEKHLESDVEELQQKTERTEMEISL